MGTSLSVKVAHPSGDEWETVVEPYLKENDNWKTVHNVWIKHGGDWELAHKTAYSRYQLFNSQTGLTNNSSITIDPSVRYLRVKLHASGGGAGGGIATGGAWAGNLHLNCPSYDFTRETVAGANGGAGGLLEVVLEVKENEVYTWNFGAETSGAGRGATLVFDPFTQYSTSTAAQGANATQAGNCTLTGPNNTNLIAQGGSGGGGGLVQVTANCHSGQHWGESVSTSQTGNTSGGTTTVAGDKIAQTITYTAAGGAPGGSGVVDATGGSGTRGYIEIHQYRASQI